LELRPFNETTNWHFREETYEIVGAKRRLGLSSNDEDGTIITASIYTVNSP